MGVDQELEEWGFDRYEHPLLPENEGDMAEPFIDPIFPHGLFNLRDQGGSEDGPFDPDDFVRDPDGVWYAQTEGRGIFLRVVDQEGSKFASLDGAGDRWDYEFVPLTEHPDNFVGESPTQDAEAS